ncbi:hypothetical protein LTR37_019019 [Vermiconidia calcicola]|uniref:Uncharacterized protein n=1 Tax=Vermiconidia calcicola TaxID=1690605 RepID=A0ACC3MGX1_9PEZI|nr:hypothetical protein LTR37_019019 [Vermiconidia calcicola]
MHDPRDEYPAKATEWRCKDAFEFKTYDIALDERVEGSRRLPMRRTTNSVEGVRGLLRTDPLWAWKTTKVANSEFLEMHDALKVLQDDVDVVNNEWENWNGSHLEMEVDESQTVGFGQESLRSVILMYWTSITGRFLCANFKFKYDGVEPHKGDPGYPALAYGIDSDEETAS